ncbi:hypothetical protein AAG570_008090 [Ranatra chinensis]|uniref:Uncharacterized protein n=1 Tax=Ranatra chinensis TaxID=642074 RepID=A0ABD0XV24_9HEMI
MYQRRGSGGRRPVTFYYGPGRSNDPDGLNVNRRRILFEEPTREVRPTVQNGPSIRVRRFFDDPPATAQTESPESPPIEQMTTGGVGTPDAVLQDEAIDGSIFVSDSPQQQSYNGLADVPQSFPTIPNPEPTRPPRPSVDPNRSLIPLDQHTYPDITPGLFPFTPNGPYYVPPPFWPWNFGFYPMPVSVTDPCADSSSPLPQYPFCPPPPQNFYVPNGNQPYYPYPYPVRHYNGPSPSMGYYRCGIPGHNHHHYPRPYPGTIPNDANTHSGSRYPGSPFTIPGPIFSSTAAPAPAPIPIPTLHPIDITGHTSNPDLNDMASSNGNLQIVECPEDEAYSAPQADSSFSIDPTLESPLSPSSSSSSSGYTPDGPPPSSTTDPEINTPAVPVPLDLNSVPSTSSSSSQDLSRPGPSPGISSQYSTNNSSEPPANRRTSKHGIDKSQLLRRLLFRNHNRGRIYEIAPGPSYTDPRLRCGPAGSTRTKETPRARAQPKFTPDMEDSDEEDSDSDSSHSQYSEPNLKNSVRGILMEISCEPSNVEDIMYTNYLLLSHFTSSPTRLIHFGRTVAELSLQELSLVEGATRLSSIILEMDPRYSFYLGLVNFLLSEPESSAYGSLVVQMYCKLADKEGLRYIALRDAVLSYFRNEATGTPRSKLSDTIELLASVALELSLDCPSALKAILAEFMTSQSDMEKDGKLDVSCFLFSACSPSSALSDCTNRREDGVRSREQEPGDDGNRQVQFAIL